MLFFMFDIFAYRVMARSEERGAGSIAVRPISMLVATSHRAFFGQCHSWRVTV